ncbi:hypothetical protein BLNAU_14162 [Blattamonas nauphoetae]|uniref:Uncharacterized protein n=1 Tax=Blattamonas nauphoetae TaxID=2049346 RepID=A0ABQ9XL51_9EUKA|nr:hypothetical protein BLNAU_14162 [Blattamonas nauphoetae]
MSILLLLCSILHCVDEHFHDFDAAFEKELHQKSFGSNSELMQLSFDDGLYWTNCIEIVSKSVELHGNKTGLTHRANVKNLPSRIDEETANGRPRKDTNVEQWMMEAQNSSVTIRSFRLDAGMEGTSVCLVRTSSVEVIDSEILSNMECSGFVLSDSDRSGESRIVIVGSHHKSSTPNIVLPLVGRVYGQMNKNNEEWMFDEEESSGGWVDREDIIGIELSFDSTHFALGTGPLFSFSGKSLPEGSDIGMVGVVSTELKLSSLSNVTSSFVDGGESLGVGNSVCERVVGSKISRSTNHDMGTGLCGTRLGGNIVCVNCSFSSCMRTANAIIGMKHKNITQTTIGRTIVTKSSGITSVKFTLCTFNTMNFIIGPHEGGAAIFLSHSRSTLIVAQCFFHKCTCTSGFDHGAAIFVSDTRADCPISISESSFTECAVTDVWTNRGGSVYCSSTSTVSITDCFFEKSHSARFSGAIHLESPTLATLSNCAFVSCSSIEFGGTLGLFAVDLIDFSFLQFRECSVTRHQNSKDIYFERIASSQMTSTSVRFCDSTSGKPNVYDSTGSVDRSYLVPQLMSTPSVKVRVSFSGDVATVTATANPAVKGTMGILLEGSNVPRLVHVQFGTSLETSTTGIAEVSSGVNGILPLTAYSLRASSISNIYICSAHSSLKDWNTTKIVLNGINLGVGSFSMLIRNGDKTFNISLTRSDSTTLVGKAPLHPMSASGRLEWATEYDVEKVIWRRTDGGDEIVRLFNRISFTTPNEPPRLVSLKSCSLNGRKDELTISFLTSSLPEGTGTIKVKPTGSEIIVEGVLTRDSDTQYTVVISTAWTANATHLSFGTTYSVESATFNSVAAVIDSGISFDVPNPPVITSFSIPVECSSDSFEIVVNGQNFPSLQTYTLTLSELQTHTISLRFSESTKGTGTVKASLPSKIQFDRTYSVSSVTKGDDHVLLNETIFTTPLGPTLLSISTSLTTPLKKEVLLSLNGLRMKCGTHNLTFQERDTSTEFSISVTIDNTTTGNGKEDIYGGKILKYGTTYEVTSLTSDSLHFALAPSLTFTTDPEPPRVCSCVGSVLNKDRSKVTISLEGRALTVSFGSIWVSFGGTFWESLSIRKISATLCEADFLVNAEQTETRLKYEGEYTVCVNPHEASSLLVDSGITVRIPPPLSFTEVEFEFTNSLGTGCIAILTGSNLVKGTEYTVALNTSHTFSIVVKSSKKAESCEMVIGFEGSLAYSTDILVESIEPIDEESGIALMPSSITGQTPARPDVNEINVDTAGPKSWTCGNPSRPCTTLDAAWKVMQKLEIWQPTLSLLNSTSLSFPMTIGSGMSVLIQNGTPRKPSLHIASSAVESATSALIVVSSALLKIDNVDIVVGSSKPSFILISALSSEMVLKDGLMTIKDEPARSRNEMEELCLWRTGLIELTDTELNVTNSRFLNISQGAIRMKGGQVNIQGSVFTDNSPNLQNFPSARRNIACSKGGNIVIGSLEAGDGLNESSAWISSDGCSIESTEVNAASPLFIPTLSSDSTSKFDKKTKSFTLSIEGSTLIPCSLLLKVMEMEEDGTEGDSTLIPLTVDSVTSFTDSSIVVTLPSLSLESLDDTLEWRGRLVFGENRTTSNSFLIQQNSSGRVAQAIRDNMKWWIPLVVVLSCALLSLIPIVVLLMRRRNKNKGGNDEMDGEQEMVEIEDESDVLKDESDSDDDPHSVHTAFEEPFTRARPDSDLFCSESDQNTNRILPASADGTTVLFVGGDDFGRLKNEVELPSSQDGQFERQFVDEEKLDAAQFSPSQAAPAVNARRQMEIEIVPRMALGEEDDVASLLLDCLDLNPRSRPSLESVASHLESIGERRTEAAADLLDLLSLVH